MGWFNHKDRAASAVDFAQGKRPSIQMHQDTDDERAAKTAYYQTKPEHLAYTPRMYNDGISLIPVDLHEDAQGKYHPKAIY